MGTVLNSIFDTLCTLDCATIVFSVGCFVFLMNSLNFAECSVFGEVLTESRQWPPTVTLTLSRLVSSRLRV